MRLDLIRSIETDLGRWTLIVAYTDGYPFFSYRTYHIEDTEIRLRHMKNIEVW